MASDLENLVARRSAVYAELAALTPLQPGGRPNISGGGAGSPDHQGYKRGLLDEIASLNQLIAIAQGPVEAVTRGYP